MGELSTFPQWGGPDEGRANGRTRWKAGEEILGRYVVVGELGQGGMGVVYECLDKVGGVKVAVKCLPPELSHNSVEMEEVRANFELVYRLNHPNIIAVKTLERDENGGYYLVMDVAEGESLRTWMRRKRKEGGIAPEEAIGILRQVASALDYAHREKVVHRDVKPGNVIIDGKRGVKVLDFGLAAQIRRGLAVTEQANQRTSGTGPYMAPEQWKGRSQDWKTDQYALGVVAYEMFAGRLPFENSDLAVLKDAVLHEKAPAIPGMPKRAMRILRGALAKQGKDRWWSCSAFVDALEECYGRGGGRRKAGGRWVAVLLVLGVAGAGNWWLWQIERQSGDEKTGANGQADAVVEGIADSVPSESASVEGGESEEEIASDGRPMSLGDTEPGEGTESVQAPDGDSTSLASKVREASIDMLDKKNRLAFLESLDGDSLLEAAAFMGADPTAQECRKQYLQVKLELDKRVKEFGKEDSKAEALQMEVDILKQQLDAAVERAKEKLRTDYESAQANWETLQAEFLATQGGGETGSEQRGRADEKVLEEPELQTKAESLGGVEEEQEAGKAGGMDAREIGIDLGGGVKLEMVHCPDIRPDFWIAKYEVTQEQWQRVMGWNLSHARDRAKNPVENVTWYHCQEFAKKLNELPSVRADGLVFRLPTAEEWEMACRAGGAQSVGFCKLGDGVQISRGTLPRVAWYGKNWDDGPTAVGSFLPNAWGLHDMHGNVWEWTQSADGDQRLCHGGSFLNSAGVCTASFRYRNYPHHAMMNLGFRLAATARNSSE